MTTASWNFHLSSQWQSSPTLVTCCRFSYDSPYVTCSEAADTIGKAIKCYRIPRGSPLALIVEYQYWNPWSFPSTSEILNLPLFLLLSLFFSFLHCPLSPVSVAPPNMTLPKVSLTYLASRDFTYCCKVIKTLQTYFFGYKCFFLSSSSRKALVFAGKPVFGNVLSIPLLKFLKPEYQKCILSQGWKDSSPCLLLTSPYTLNTTQSSVFS